MIANNYIEKTYAGWLGKVIGIRMGAPVEGWSKEKIHTMVGERFTDYIVDYQDFAADDDSNGPVYFIRALNHYKKVTAREFGYTFLNYVPKEHGFFWWGEELSTEHTAYKNLLAGVEAPESGSAKRNGKELAEQIGGQIFVDAFGFVAPGNPQLAASLAENCAKVTHDLNAVEGARYVAACISLAYTKSSVKEIMEEALTYIKEGNYHAVVSCMIRCYESKLDWEDAFLLLRERYWTDQYPGVCHIIPNAGIMALGMIYGEGDFVRSQELVNLCGFDTDCNAGNVGAIIGVLNGIGKNDGDKGIPKRLISPIKDVMLASGITGSLNISTLSENTLLFTEIGYMLAQEQMPEPYNTYAKELHMRGIRHSHFSFPHALHGFRIKGEYKNAETSLTTTKEAAYQGTNGLKITINNLHPANSVLIFQKTYYTPKDLHDARYQPAFSPVSYPGDHVSCYLRNVTGQKIKAYLYYFDLNKMERIRFAEKKLYDNKDEIWFQIKGQIPSDNNRLVKEIGIELVSEEITDSYFGEQVCIFMDEFLVKSEPNYGMDFAQIPIEDYTLHQTEQAELSGFTHYNKDLDGMSYGLNGFILSSGEKIFTGDYYWRNYYYEITFSLLKGERADIIFRSQGTIRNYFLRLKKDRVQFICQMERDEMVLSSMELSLEYEKEYTAVLEIKDNCFTVTIGKDKMQAEDKKHTYVHGGIGVQVDDQSAILLKSYQIKSI